MGTAHTVALCNSKKTRKTHAKLTVRFTCQQCIAFHFSIYIIIMLTLSSGAVSEVKHRATYLKQRAETKNLHQSGTCKCRKKSAVNGLFCTMGTYFEFRTLGCTLQALVQRNPPQLTNRLTNVSQSCWYIDIEHWAWNESLHRSHMYNCLDV